MPAATGGVLSFDLEWRTTAATLFLLPLLVGLGFWQLQRADEKALLAAAWEQRQSQPPVPLAQLWAEPAETLGYLPVSLAGVFVADKYFLLDNRVMGGRFGFEVIGILELDDAAGVVLVNRGWIAADPARRELPQVPSVPGRVELTGHVYVAPGTPYLLAEQELGAVWPKLLQAIEMDKLVPLVQAIGGNRAFPYPVRIAARQPGALTVDWQVVNVSPDKHRAYAAQWFTMALALLVLFLLRSSNLWQLLRPRRNDQR
jgi:cytochrome oxidase assembly protein ShyY1